ncbi:MAG: YIP1 family protein [Acidobacteriota bacterium]
MKVGNQFRTLIDVIWSPARGVEALARHAPLLLPVLVFSVSAMLVNWFSMPFAEHVARLSMPDSLDPEQAQQVLALTHRISLFSALFSPLSMLVKWVILAGLLYLVSILANGRMRFRQAYSLVAFASIALVAEWSVGLTVMLLKGLENIQRPFDLVPALGLTLIFRDVGLGWFTLLNSINLFQIWFIVLLVIGIASMNGFSRWKSGWVVVSVWLFQTAVGALTTGLSGLGG